MTMPICKDTTNELLVNVVGLRQQLDRTREALEIAVDVLKLLKEKAYLTEYAQHVIDKALNKITALEQKDK